MTSALGSPREARRTTPGEQTAMETWLILFGVLLPLAPLLQFAEQRLEEREPQPEAVPVGDADERRR